MQTLFNSISKTQEEKLADALLWLEGMRLASKWDLTHDEVCALMGGITRNTYKSWITKAKSDGLVKLGKDTVTRLSLLAGIHKALILSAPQGYEFDFFKRPINHPLFKGESIKDHILKDSDILRIAAVRNHFDARRA